MTEVARASIQTSRDTIKNVLNEYITKNRALAGADQTTRKLIAQLYIGVVFHRQANFSISNYSVNADLVAKGLLMSCSDEGMQSYCLDDEPIFFAALDRLIINVQYDIVAEYLLSPCQILDYVTSIKGKVTEYLITWYFIRTIRQRGYLSLFDLLHGVTAENFTLLASWKKVMVETRQCSPVQEEENGDFVTLVKNADYNTLQYNMHQNIGPDMCFLVKVSRNNVTHMGAVLIQCKAHEEFSFNDAVRSVQLGTFAEAR